MELMMENVIKVSEIKTTSTKELAMLYRVNNKIPLADVLGDEGNHKIPASTAIFNMSSARDCSSLKLGLCKAQKQNAKCYAFKAEVMYPQVLPFRIRQGKFWDKVTAEDFAFQFLMLNVTKKSSFLRLRFNESGDFKSQACVDKAEKIARILKRSGIKTYCYTSRNDLNFTQCRDLVVTGSGFMKKGISSQFSIVKDLKDRPAKFGICPMNCRVCNRCSTKGLKTVVRSH
jgi:hypothetical protein